MPLLCTQHTSLRSYGTDQRVREHGEQRGLPYSWILRLRPDLLVCDEIGARRWITPPHEREIKFRGDYAWVMGLRDAHEFYNNVVSRIVNGACTSKKPDQQMEKHLKRHEKKELGRKDPRVGTFVTDHGKFLFRDSTLIADGHPFTPEFAMPRGVGMFLARTIEEANFDFCHKKCTEPQAGCNPTVWKEGSVENEKVDF